jgi:hypothetical protein
MNSFSAVSVIMRFNTDNVNNSYAETAAIRRGLVGES